MSSVQASNTINIPPRSTPRPTNDADRFKPVPPVSRWKQTVNKVKTFFTTHKLTILRLLSILLILGFLFGIYYIAMNYTVFGTLLSWKLMGTTPAIPNL